MLRGYHNWRRGRISTMASAPPQFDTFNPAKDEWNSWSCRFEQWLLLSPFSTGNDAEAKKQAALCTYVGSSTFKFLCSLCAPDELEDPPYADLKGKLDKQYGVKRLVLAECHRFYTYKQGKAQPLPEYVSKLG